MSRPVHDQALRRGAGLARAATCLGSIVALAAIGAPAARVPVSQFVEQALQQLELAARAGIISPTEADAAARRLSQLFGCSTAISTTATYSCTASAPTRCGSRCAPRRAASGSIARSRTRTLRAPCWAATWRRVRRSAKSSCGPFSSELRGGGAKVRRFPQVARGISRHPARAVVTRSPGARVRLDRIAVARVRRAREPLGARPIAPPLRAAQFARARRPIALA